ncbi:MAG: methyltransferase domain-containing protein [Planctomycetota bacterium]|jgi:SAM-dependent methyltransferase
MLDWTQVAELRPLRINFGSRNDCRGGGRNQTYDDYVGVGSNVRGDWAVIHSFPNLLPLPDGCIDRALSEQMLEHLNNTTLDIALREICRTLMPGALFRIGVPDAWHPEYDQLARPQKSPRRSRRYHWQHFTVDSLTAVLLSAGFSRVEPLTWWDGAGEFQHKGIDYSLGWIRRTPEHRYLRADRWKGYAICPTSLVVDTYK